MKKPNVIFIQGKSQGSIDKNLEYYTLKINEVTKHCNDKEMSSLIVLPELFLWDYFPITEDKEHFSSAITIDSNEVKYFQDIAKKLKINLILPIFENASNIFFNSSLTINENGEIISHYRKMHIPYDPGFYEKFYFTPGNKDFLVSNTSIGKIGVLICFDQWFPEPARILSLKGAQIIIYPTAIGWDEREDKSLQKGQLDAWVTVMRGHAIANGVYVVAVNRVGKEGHLTFWGNSFICDPFGKILIMSNQDEDIQSFELNLNKIPEIRNVWTFLRDRRTDSYSELLKS